MQIKIWAFSKMFVRFNILIACLTLRQIFSCNIWKYKLALSGYDAIYFIVLTAL